MITLRKGWKRVLALGDMHCGHIIGLTHPDYQFKIPTGPEVFFSTAARKKQAEIQRQTYEFYKKTIKEIGPVKLTIVNGDCIDGKGNISRATELITADRDLQVQMAIKALSEINSKNWCFTFGTAYHTGMGEDYEVQIADHFDSLPGGRAEIGAHQWPVVNGVVFDVKHFIGSSGVPYGRSTSVSKDDTWNALWNVDDNMQPRAQIVLRSHVHYYRHTDYVAGGKTHHIATLPALQAMGSKFGARKCTGRVDFGVVTIDCPPTNSKEQPIWRHHVGEITGQRAHTSKF